MFLFLLSLLSILLVQGNLDTTTVPTRTLLATHAMPLSDRYGVQSVNTVFKENILLTLFYLQKIKQPSQDVPWDTVNKPFHYEFVLQPGQVFAFDNDVLSEYKKELTQSTNAHFTGQEGFQSDGYLYGDGVCHLASLFYWVAKDAKLTAYAPTNHDFAVIPDIPKEYGVAIYNDGQDGSMDSMQNLYITNSEKNPIRFIIDYHDNTVDVSIVEEKNEIVPSIDKA